MYVRFYLNDGSDSDACFCALDGYAFWTLTDFDNIRLNFITCFYFKLVYYVIYTV